MLLQFKNQVEFFYLKTFWSGSPGLPLRVEKVLQGLQQNYQTEADMLVE